MTTFARLAWQSHGRPPPLDLGDKVKDRPEPCYLCGESCATVGAVARKVAILATFNDGPAARCGLSSWVCVPCVWSQKARVDERRKDGLSPGGKPKRSPWIRCFTVWSDGESHRILDKGQRDQIAALLLADHSRQWGCAVSDSGQKQLIWRSPVNPPGEHRAIRLEEQLITYRREHLRRLLGLMNALLAAGFSKGELEGGDYQSRKILAFGVERWQRAEQILKAHRGAGPFALAHWLCWREESAFEPKETRGNQTGPGGPGGGDSAMPAGQRRPPKDVGAHPVGARGRGRVGGQLGKAHRERDPAAEPRQSAAARDEGGGQRDFGW